MFFSIFFINVGETKAADSCICHFYGEGEERKEQIGGNNPRTIVKKDIYLVEFTVHRGEHKYTNDDIIYFGEANIQDYVNDNFKSTTELKSLLVENTKNAKFLANYDTVSYSRVVDRNCSKTACDGIAITFHSCANSKEFALGVRAANLGCVNVNMKAISDDDADTAKETLYGKGKLESVTDEDKEKTNDYTSILSWGSKAHEGEYSSEDVGTTCNSIGEIGNLLNQILWIVDIIAIIILIIMTMVDLIKAIVGSEEDTLRKAFKQLIVRIIIVVILLLLPAILGSVISLANQETGIVQIGENGEPFCNVE